jgi:hypothetical protein
MFSNLNRRERLMALVVAGLLPLFAVMWGANKFSGSYFERQSKIRDLHSQVTDELDKQLNAELAAQRRHYYRQHSLPTDLNHSTIQYDSWLTEIVQQRAQMDLESVTPPTKGSNRVRFMSKNKPTDVFDEVSFKVRANGSLGQVVEMLTAFYDLDMMHRISSLTLTPIKKSTGSGSSEILTGLLRVEFDVDVISLVDADTQRDFIKELASSGTNWEAATKPILTRNIFGPANNTPSISYLGRSFETGKTIEIALTGDDADEQDQIRFAVIGSEVEGAVIEQKEDERRATLTVPPQSTGRFEVKVRVSDNGFPPKSTEQLIGFDVNEPKPVLVEAEKPKPKFKHAQATTVSAILTNNSGDLVCWIHIKTLNQLNELKLNQSFELDDQTWTVTSIENRQVTLQVEESLLTFRLGDKLDSPFETKRLGDLTSKVTSTESK